MEVIEGWNLKRNSAMQCNSWKLKGNAGRAHVELMVGLPLKTLVFERQWMDSRMDTQRGFRILVDTTMDSTEVFGLFFLSPETRWMLSEVLSFWMFDSKPKVFLNSENVRFCCYSKVGGL